MAKDAALTALLLDFGCVAHVDDEGVALGDHVLGLGR